MTKRTLNAHELEIIAGGAIDLAEDAPATAKDNDVMKDDGSSSSGSNGGGSIDTSHVQQNQDLPGA